MKRAIPIAWNEKEFAEITEMLSVIREAKPHLKTDQEIIYHSLRTEFLVSKHIISMKLKPEGKAK